ncbi:MAG: TIGR03089 family protein [Sciscionella sp.]|nr:TIGR03089 family protein [Sciscionella sp.]
MTITERLLLPLLATDSARPLITHYDDGIGSRVELSVATVTNWAAKTANWLCDEFDVAPGSPVAVALPAHWQTLGVLLGAWWCGAHVVDDPDGAEVVFTAPNSSIEGVPNARAAQAGAPNVIVALDPLGQGLPDEPPSGAFDYLTEVRMCADDFTPWQETPGDTPALDRLSVDEVLATARKRAAELELGTADRILSTVDWTIPDGVLDAVLAVLAAGASLVQVANADPAKFEAKRASERITRELS